MKVSILNNIISNVPSNFNLHETIICDDRNPPWFCNEMKNLIKKNNILYKLNLTSDKDTNKLEPIKCLQSPMHFKFHLRKCKK